MSCNFLLFINLISLLPTNLNLIKLNQIEFNLIKKQIKYLKI